MTFFTVLRAFHLIIISIFDGSIIMFFPISMMEPKYFVVLISNSHSLTFNPKPVFRKRFKFYLFISGVLFGYQRCKSTYHRHKLNKIRQKKSLRTQLIYLWKILKTLAKPNGMINYINKPNLILNAIILSSFSVIFIL